MRAKPHRQALINVSMWIMFFASLVSVSFRQKQDINYDQINYHYYVSYALIHWRYWRDIAPAQIVHTYLNPLIYVPWYAATTLVGPKFATLLQCALQSTAIFPLMGVVRILLPGQKNASRLPTRILTIVLALASPMLWSEAGTSFADAALATPIVASLYFCLKWRRSGDDRNLTLSGLCLGVAAGLKLTCGIYEPGLLLIGVMPFVRGRISFRALAMQPMAFMMGLIASSGWLFALCFLKFRNPVFPYFNSVFHAVEGANRSYRDTAYVPHSLLSALSFPLRWAQGGSITSELFFRDIRPLIALALICALAVGLIAPRLRLRRQQCEHTESPDLLIDVIVFFVASIVVWMCAFSIQRYFLPGEIISGVIIGACLDRLLSARFSVALLIVIEVGSFASLRISDWGHTNWLRTTYDLTIPAQFQDATMVFIAGEPFAFAGTFFSPDATLVGMTDWDNRNPSQNSPFTRQIKEELATAGAKPAVI
ncbi:glycosyltransferase family 87 protein, partial [Acetobacter sp. DsW_063]|uniref:glycosyltransferase 87 family protein n=1 Tax=Acetobacter sp. DsW_063 TaxID=1514894 RepID=UPI0011776E02